MTYALLALGANMDSNWGQPMQTFNKAVKQLDAAAVNVAERSALYYTAPLSFGRQARYYNTVLRIYTRMPPNSLLHIIKTIEKNSGRKLGQHWGARPLDIDIIDFSGYRMGWPAPELGRCGAAQGRRSRGSLILPHPQMHLRSFVLIPLLDVAPMWRHPVFGLGLKALISRLPLRERLGLPGTRAASLRTIVRVAD